MKRGTAFFPKMLISKHTSTRRYNPDQDGPHRREDLKSHGSLQSTLAKVSNKYTENAVCLVLAPSSLVEFY